MTRGGGDRAHLKRQLEERGHCGILGTNDWAVQLVYSKKKNTKLAQRQDIMLIPTLECWALLLALYKTE